VPEPELLEAPAAEAGAARDDPQLDVIADRHDPVPVPDVERLHELARLAVVEAAVGEDSVDVEQEELHPGRAGEQRAAAAPWAHLLASRAGRRLRRL
jgi:hypothetical protein